MWAQRFVFVKNIAVITWKRQVGASYELKTIKNSERVVMAVAATRKNEILSLRMKVVGLLHKGVK